MALTRRDRRLARRHASDPSIRPAMLVASGRRLNPVDDLTKLRSLRQPWQTEAWAAYDLGDLKYPVNYQADTLSQVRLYPALGSGDDRLPTETDDRRAVESLQRLGGPSLDFESLLAAAVVNLVTVGECYLTADPSDPQPRIRSIDEIQLTRPVHIRDSPIDPWRPLPDGSFLGRLWIPHRRFHDLADSPVRGILDPVETLRLLDRYVRGSLRQRIALAGILPIPEELTFGGPDPTQDTFDDPRADPAIDNLLSHMETAMADEDSAAAMVPLLLIGKAEYLKAIQPISLDRPLDPMIAPWTQRANERIAQGLNLPASVVQGMEALTRWQVPAVDESLWKAHLRPLARAITQALTQAWHHPMLKEAKVSDWAAHYIAADPSALLVHPTRSQDADDGLDRGAISWDAWRRVHGFTKADTPTPDEQIQQAILKRGQYDPAITQQLLSELFELKALMQQVVVSGRNPNQPPAGVGEGEPSNPPDEGPGETQRAPGDQTGGRPRGRSNPDEQVTGSIGNGTLDHAAALTLSLDAASDAAIRRIIERCGLTVLRSARSKASLKAVSHTCSPYNACSTFGPAVCEELGVTGDMITADYLDPLARAWDRYATEAQIRSLADFGVTHADPASVALLADARARGWQTLSAACLESARAHLFTALPDASLAPAAELSEAVGIVCGAVGMYADEQASEVRR